MPLEDRECGQENRSFIETARRKQIVDCAIDAIATLGYAQASLSQIAKRAKVSKGVISYYFPSKDELLKEVVNSIFIEGAKFMAPRIEAETTALRRLRTYIEANIAFMQSHRKELAAVVDVLIHARTAEGQPLFDPAGYEFVIADLENALIRGQQSGELGQFSPRVVAVTIRAAIDAVPQQLAVRPDLDLATYGRELADLFEKVTRKD